MMQRVFICLIAVLSSFAVLHGGRTDSSGGHYNSSTGEYHYHHGYSAHDHYDMNGDGIVDCPFAFNDNTKSQSEYNSFDEWSNAVHGISKEQEEEDEKKRQAYLSRNNGVESSDNGEKEKPSVTFENVLVVVFVVIVLLESVVDFINHKHRK